MRRKSSVMIGRDALLSRLVSQLDEREAERPRLLLIRGEAGIGKSRLLEEFLRQARRKEIVVLKGDCLPLRLCGGPLAPLGQALRAPVVQVTDPGRRAVVDAELAGLAHALSRLGVAGAAAPKPCAARLIEQVLGVLVRLSGQVSIVLALEDIHWADTVTRELVQFLHHNLRGARVLLVLTDRTDEPSLPASHAALVTDLVRAGADVVELASLGVEDVRHLLAARGDSPVPVEVAGEIHRRSGGNPLYCEFLQDAWGSGDDLPPTLKDLLLDRAVRVSPRTRALLELLAVVGHPASEELLTSMGDGTAVAPCAREAVDAKILVFDESAYRFRHSLIAEALLGELLPGDLAVLHRRVAAVLAARPALSQDAPHLVALRVAHHWYAAGEWAAALESAVRAGVMLDLSAPTDALHLYERALALSERLADWPVLSIGKAEVLRRAAEASFHLGAVTEAVGFVQQALEVTDGRGAGGPSRALLYEHLGRYLESSNSRTAAQERQAWYRRALEELSRSDTLQVRAQVLCSCGLSRVLTGRQDEGMTLLHEAREIADDSGDRRLQAITLLNLAEASSCVRDLARSTDYARRARDAAVHVGYADVALRTYFTEAKAVYLASGRLLDSILIRREGLRFADRYGQAHSGGTVLRLALIEDLIEAGFWNEAAQLIADCPRHDPRSILGAEENLILCYLAAERGQAVDGAHVSELCGRLPADNWAHEAYFLSLLIPLASAAHHARAIEELTDRALELVPREVPRFGNGLFLVHALTAALQAHARGPGGAAAPCTHRLPDLLERAESVYARARTFVSATSELTDGVIEIARAEAGGRPGRDNGGHWASASAVFHRTGALARLAPALHGEAQVLLEEGDRAEAGKKAREAHDLAVAMGAEPLRRRIEAFAQSGGIRLTDTGPFAGLTPRQTEVLRLMADGLTDQEIARELTISTRTANSHVASILGRLGVRNRSEATTRYHRRKATAQHAPADEPLPVGDL